MSKNTTYNEENLVSRISEGDEAAFSDFYEHYYTILRPFVVRNAPSAQATREILQTTFLRVWLNRHKLEEIENMKSWMIRIASREYLTYVRDNLSKRLANRVFEEDPETVSEQLIGRDEYTYYSIKEIRSLVAAAVEKLSGQRKLIFELSRNEYLSIREIADKLQLSPKTVKNTLTASLSEIRDHLRANGYDLLAISFFSFLQLF